MTYPEAPFPPSVSERIKALETHSGDTVRLDEVLKITDKAFPVELVSSFHPDFELDESDENLVLTFTALDTATRLLMEYAVRLHIADLRASDLVNARTDEEMFKEAEGTLGRPLTYGDLRPVGRHAQKATVLISAALAELVHQVTHNVQDDLDDLVEQKDGELDNG